MARRAAKYEVPPWIEEGMARRQWTNMDLSRVTGLNPNTIGQLRKGLKQPNVTTLKTIARAFEADPEGTSIAIGSIAAKGAVEQMVHDNRLFADVYLAFKDLTRAQQEEARNFIVDLRLRRRGTRRESESVEEDQ